jgi:ribose transport system substrate-binding protein
MTPLPRTLRIPVLLALAVLCAGTLRAQALAPKRIHYRIAVIPKGTTHEYWKAIEAGANKAAHDLRDSQKDVEIIWKGPLVEDDREQQIQVVENFIGEKISAIVIAPLDSKALVAPIEEAVMDDIPVVVIDSALNSRMPASVVSTNNVKGGMMAARRLGTLLGGKGRVVMLRYQVGSASTEQREAGFLKAMASEFPGIALISTDQYCGATRETAYKAAQNVLNQFSEKMDGIFAPNESSASGTLLALRELNLAGKVKFVGFDANPQLVEALQKGDIQGLVLQDPFRMGYYGVTIAVGAIRHEEVPPEVDTGVTLATAEDMNDPKVAILLHPPIDKYIPNLP